MSSGLTVWWLGTSFETVKGPAGTVQGFRAWNFFGWGVFGYETNNLVIDGWINPVAPGLHHDGIQIEQVLLNLLLSTIMFGGASATARLVG